MHKYEISPEYMSDDELLRRIKARQAAYRNKSMRKLMKLIGLEAGRTYTNDEIYILTERAGKSYYAANPLMGFGVDAGYLKRVGRGLYYVTGKHLDETA
jgi:hypothetical protein